jgi:hypothetical protein
MIGVAGSARGREYLPGLMDGTIMAHKAFLVGDLFVEKTKAGYVAGGAALGKNGVRGGQGPGGVNAAVAAKRMPRDPQQSERHSRNRKHKSPAVQRARPLKIIEVNALRELLGCACSRQEF